MKQHEQEVRSGDRFEFGKNWQHFLRVLNEDRIGEAENSLRERFGQHTLSGQRFLDLGCGSGLFSLAARRLGAKVHSVDYDPQSVACARELKARYFPEDAEWSVEEGSALDAPYIASLGTFDIVYSWGVLHHTGSMWRALEIVDQAVAPGGALCIAIYNDKGAQSERWTKLKKTYCSLPSPLRAPFAVVAVAPLEAKEIAKSILRLRPQEYVETWTKYDNRRGMSRWHDIIDWVGGYPYEVATAEEITRFYKERGYSVDQLLATNGLGCNEFVLRKEEAAGSQPGPV